MLDGKEQLDFTKISLEAALRLSLANNLDIAQAREVVAQSRFALQSEWLTKLIRSGHFKDLALAVPRTNAEVQAQDAREARGIRVRLFGNELQAEVEHHASGTLSSLGGFALGHPNRGQRQKRVDPERRCGR